MKTWFSSDWHLNHVKVIRFDGRPFATVEEMNETIIQNHNKLVKPNDVFYHLGDIGFGKTIEEYIARINGRLHFIKGNHDKKDTIKLYEKYGVYHGDRTEIKVQDQIIILDHYSLQVWNKSHYGTWHLFGHSHGSLTVDNHSRKMDVGINVHNYMPIEFAQIKTIMDSKDWKPLDKHTHK